MLASTTQQAALFDMAVESFALQPLVPRLAICRDAEVHRDVARAGGPTNANRLLRVDIVAALALPMLCRDSQ